MLEKKNLLPLIIFNHRAGSVDFFCSGRYNFRVLDVLGASLSDAGNGVKSLRVSPDGRHLAAGGRDGNLW